MYEDITPNEMLSASKVCAAAANDPLNAGEVASMLNGAARVLSNTCLRATGGVTVDKVSQAIVQLGRSGKGRSALQDLLAFLDNGAVTLDTENQAAVRLLIDAVWGPLTGTARDIMRAHLSAGE